jgi:hypothetical protein
MVATDEHKGYHYLNAIGYPHETVNHGAGEYVRGEVHTANPDSFWALLKRGIVGTYHNVSKTISRCSSRNFNSATIIAKIPIFSGQSLQDAEDAALDAASAVDHPWSGTETGALKLQFEGESCQKQSRYRCTH